MDDLLRHFGLDDEYRKVDSQTLACRTCGKHIPATNADLHLQVDCGGEN